jgi:hypothetical protein
VGGPGPGSVALSAWLTEEGLLPGGRQLAEVAGRAAAEQGARLAAETRQRITHYHSPFPTTAAPPACATAPFLLERPDSDAFLDEILEEVPRSVFGQFVARVKARLRRPAGRAAQRNVSCTVVKCIGPVGVRD